MAVKLPKLRLLDLFSGRWGWSRAFAARGWECIGVDLTEPPEIPDGCKWLQKNILRISADWVAGSGFDFVCASSPCEEFSKWGLRCFYPNPPYPEVGIDLFNHTRAICERVQVPYVMENVRAAQYFVGGAVDNCGPFYLWGNSVPPLLPQGIQKGLQLGNGGWSGKEQVEFRKKHSNPVRDAWSGSEKRRDATAVVATIPRELSSCVADYAERILEQSRA
jgi:hypothetical protein